MHLPSPNGLWLAGPLAALLMVALIDLRSRRIPNSWVALLFGAGVAHAAFSGPKAILAALGGAALGLALLLWQYSKGLIGAGDVKLLAAIGAWTGPLGVMIVFLAASVLGGLLSVAALVSLGGTERAQVRHNLFSIALARGAAIPEPSKLSRARGIPFGVSLSAATATFLLYGVWQ